MNHTCAEKLNPAFALAGGAANAAALVALNVHLAAGLGEGEVMGTETGLGALAVKLLNNGVESAFQVSHGNALINGHTLYLVEHGGMSCVNLVLAVNAAGSNNADGQLHSIHCAYLHRRGLAAEHYAAVLVEIEGVGPVAGGMSFLGVEAIKVQLCKLNFGAVENGEAHTDKYFFDFIKSCVHGVTVTHLLLFAGDGNVNGLICKTLFQHKSADCALALLKACFESVSYFVCKLSHNGALLGGEFAHLLQNCGQLTLFAQILDSQSFQFLAGLCLGNGGKGAFAQKLQLFFHFRSPYVKLFLKQKMLSSLIWDESIKLPRYHPHLPHRVQHTFWRCNGRTYRRGLAGAHGRTKRTFAQGAFSLRQPLSGEKSFSLFSRSQLFTTPLLYPAQTKISRTNLTYFWGNNIIFENYVLELRAMHLSNSENMKKADNTAIFDRGINSLALMEKAASFLAEKAYSYLGEGKSAFVFCGSGNNGGDGVAAARFLIEKGVSVRTILTGSRDKLSADTAEMVRRLENMGGCLEDFEPDVQFAKSLSEAGVIIDAMFGIGLNKPLRGKALEAVKMINESAAVVVSADIASGIEADTGNVLGDAIRADETVTFSLAKPGHFTEPGNVYTGKLSVVDIGIPEDLVNKAKIPVKALSDGEVLLPKRNPLSHKGDFGKILILGGSAEYCGAPNMCSNAAVRSGAGLVYLGVPSLIHPICAVKNTEAMPFPLSCNGDGRLSVEAFDEIKRRLDICSVCVVGPGMGRSEDTAFLVKKVLLYFGGTIVADADALWAIAQDKTVLKDSKARIVLTPHGGEAKMLGIDWGENRIAAAKSFAEEYGCTLVLKGHRTLAAFPDGEVCISTHGNPGMAKGGNGDVLAGILGAMLGQFEHKMAVEVALYLHGLAGDIACEKMGEYAMTASDIIESLPDAEKLIIRQEKYETTCCACTYDTGSASWRLR